LKNLKQPEAFTPFYTQVLMEIFRVTILRLQYPVWYQFKEEDKSDFEEDYYRYREEMVTNLFTNIASIGPFKEVLFKALAELLQNIDPKT
jgi:hypothetical protein